MSTEQAKSSRGRDVPTEAEILAAADRTGFLLDQEVATVLNSNEPLGHRLLR